MKEEFVTDESLRQFLLGQVDDEERQRVESLFITGSLSRERVLAIEQDLIDDYLEDCLTTADRERFLTQYAETSTQQRKLRIAHSVKEWATRNVETRTGPSAVSGWSRLLARLRMKPVFVVPVAVAALIAVVVTVVWLNSRMEQRNRRLAIEEELARLNAPSSLSEIPPQMSPLKLTPVSLRSVETEPELSTRAGVTVVDLRLLWLQKEQYSTYQAVVRRVGDDESFAIPDLRVEKDDGDAILIRLPAHMLSRGLYQIELSGIASGAPGPTEEYRFTVNG